MPEEKSPETKPDLQEPPASGEPTTGIASSLANHKDLKLKPPTMTADDVKPSKEPTKASPTIQGPELPTSTSKDEVKTNNSQDDIASKLISEKKYNLHISSTPARRLVSVLIIFAIISIIICSIFAYWLMIK